MALIKVGDAAPDFNLLNTQESFYNKNWILPLNDKIKGL